MANIIQSYAGVPTPAFLIVEKVQFSVLPEVDINQLDIPMKNGAYFINKKHGIRMFTAEFVIKSNNDQGIMYVSDDLASWLNYDEPQPLIFRDKPDITYYCIVNNAVEVQKFANSGRGQIQFIALDCYGYGAEREYEFNPTEPQEPVIVVNGGNVETYPKIEMEFSQNVTDFSIQTDDNALIFGKPFDESSEVAVDLNPRLIHDLCTSTSGWSAGIEVDGISDGTIQGNLVSNGGEFIQENNDYGTANGWHGGALTKSLGKEVQDFTVSVMVSLRTTVPNQIGRAEIYLFGVNHADVLGKVAIVDTDSRANNTLFEARAGTLYGGHYFAKHYPPKYLNGWDNFYGEIRISRKGNVWTGYIGKFMNNGWYWQMTKTWVDSQNKWTDLKLANIQVHLGQMHQHPTPPLMIHEVNVTEHLTPQENERGYVFKAGDKLYIDNSTGQILRNGERYYDELYPSSSFLSLKKGVNGISVNNPTIINGNLTFQERWL